MEKSLFSKVSSVYLPTNNIEESIKWYVEKLGFNLKMGAFLDQGTGGNVCVLTVPNGDTVILLVETENETSTTFLRNGKPYSAFAITCEDLHYTHQNLKERGIEVTDIVSRGGEGNGNDTALYFYIKDPMGNLIEAAWSIWD
ncbi:VOC family protein [Longirhabdus pacifica]|uniref:VOC family protein n=1 Tax=Longirhabdus pacifica TaxID=2305227 RepID=UPI0010090F07|nr:VOC family protein [Longirhabdus pacifica]